MDTRFLEASLTRLTYDPAHRVTTAFVEAPFNQIVANALGVKEIVYDETGAARAGAQSWALSYEEFGASVEIYAAQQQLAFGEKPGALTVRSTAVKDLRVSRDKDDGTMSVRFKLLVGGSIPRELVDFVEVNGEEPVVVTIVPPSEENRSTARQEAIDFGLFKVPDVVGVDSEVGVSVVTDEPPWAAEPVTVVAASEPDMAEIAIADEDGTYPLRYAVTTAQLSHAKVAAEIRVVRVSEKEFCAGGYVRYSRLKPALSIELSVNRPAFLTSAEATSEMASLIDKWADSELDKDDQPRRSEIVRVRDWVFDYTAPAL